MEAVRQALAQLTARPEVEGAALISPEGLVVAAQLSATADADALAALAVTLTRTGEQLAVAASRPTPERLVIETAQGVVLTNPLADGALLLILATPTAAVGRLLYDLRQMRGNLAALL